jgi:hypothetical protein
MTPPETLFRREAVEAWASARDPGSGEVRLGARWVTWLYRLLLLLVVLSVIALFVVHAEERVTGSAVVEPGTGAVTALLPAGAAPDLTTSRGLTVELTGGSGSRVAVEVDHAQEADDATIRRAGLVPLSQPGVLLIGHVRDRSALPTRTEGTIPAQAVVVLRTERLVDVLGRQFGVMLGRP